MSPSEQWFATLNPVTARNYRQGILQIVPDIPSFLSKAKKHPDWATSLIIKWTLAQRESEMNPQTIRTYVAAMRSLLHWNNILVNEYKISKSLPKLSKPQNREPKAEEIRKPFDIADNRGKFLITLMASSGIRIGAFNYFRLGDLIERKEGIIELVVYRGEPEEYHTLASSECLQYWKLYLQERKRSGEELTFNSPLVRQVFAGKGRRKRYEKTEIESTNSNAIRGWLFAMWHRCGFEARQFKAAHGFRAFFKTRLGETDMKDEDVERLMGHKSNGVIFAYNKKDMDYLASAYLKFQKSLFISESSDLKQSLEESEQKLSELEDTYFIRSKRLEEKASQLEAQMAERDAEQEFHRAALKHLLGTSEQGKEILKKYGIA